MPELNPGTKVAGKFSLVGRVGRGGMGEVWIARNEATDADVAIKVLRPDRRTLEQSEERFRHEARIAAKLAHPNVARVYDLLETDDGTLMLVMERLHGETLRERIQREGALSVDDVLAILLPICDALAAAHDAGVVHRDVTPGNIFLADEHGKLVPKLIDFGVAKVDDTPLHTKTGHALGTPQYMSPEQIRIGQVDGRSDEFSMAVTIYEALTATNPFKRPVASGSLAAVLEVEVDPDERIPPQVWLVLARALSKQPYERYATIREMAGALRGAAGGAPAMPDPGPRRSAPSISAEVEVRRVSESPHPVSSPVPTPVPGRRPRWPLAAAALALVVIAGGALTYAARRGRSDPGAPGNDPPPPTVVTTASSATTGASGAPPPPSADVAPSATSTAATSAKPKPTGRPTTHGTAKPSASGKPIATTPGF